MNAVGQLSSKLGAGIARQYRLDIVAVLGRRDQPTDGVEDYCRFLGQSLEREGNEFSIVRAPWKEEGWFRATREISRQASEWRNKSVLLQFTSLSWSRRGFPLGILLIARRIKRSGARLTVVYHEPDATRQPGIISSFRTRCQRFVIRKLYRMAEHAVFTVPLSSIAWLPAGDRRSFFIPIGANVPSEVVPETISKRSTRTSVGVFCLTEGQQGQIEAGDIAMAVREASKNIPGLELHVFGRGAEEAGPALQSALAGSNIKVSISGVLSAEAVARTITQLHAMLFVRGSVSLRRGTALAAVACGVPLIAYQSDENIPPLKEAGVITVPSGDAAGLGAALSRVLGNEALWNALHEKSLKSQQEVFSWSAIARRFAEILAR